MWNTCHGADKGSARRDGTVSTAERAATREERARARVRPETLRYQEMLARFTRLQMARTDHGGRKFVEKSLLPPRELNFALPHGDAYHRERGEAHERRLGLLHESGRRSRLWRRCLHASSWSLLLRGGGGIRRQAAHGHALALIRSDELRAGRHRCGHRSLPSKLIIGGWRLQPHSGGETGSWRAARQARGARLQGDRRSGNKQGVGDGAFHRSAASCWRRAVRARGRGPHSAVGRRL